MIRVHEHRYEYMEEINKEILRQIPYNKAQSPAMVLDVGCGSGALSKAIQDKGYSVWGIESNKEAAAKADGRIHKVINADLTEVTLVKQEIGQKVFDYIVFSDVLEHVYDPFSIIKEYLVFLKRGGFILVSVPNAVAWTNRLKFLFGRFEYSDTGIMDRTHIRFFTFRTSKLLVKAAGCTIVRVDYSPYFLRVFLWLIKRIYTRGQDVHETDRRQLIDSQSYKWYVKYIYPVEYCVGYLCRSLFAFRIIIVGRKI